jgi:hypothetical protein
VRKLPCRGQWPGGSQRRRPFLRIRCAPAFSPEKLAFFLLDPHPKMPSFPLSRTEAGDIAAYIGSLRP